VIPARSVSGWVALVSSIVAAVAAAVWLDVSGDGAKAIVGLSVAGPPLVVALLGPAFRVVHVLAIASAAYAAWFCVVARDDDELAGDDMLGALELWPVAVAWLVAAVVAFASAFYALRRRRRRLARLRAK
jgi:hypothetical protein